MFHMISPSRRPVNRFPGPFPEVPAALARLQTRYKIVVLSNGDPDMLEAAQTSSGPATVGATFRGANKVMGLRMPWTSKITE